MDTTTLEQYIRAGESLKVEFKGEQRESLSDREIYETVVCLANADGGVLLVGVENDGRLTGARPRHGATTDPYRLQAAIFNNTEPPINTRVSVQTVDGKPVVVIEVDPYPEIGSVQTEPIRRTYALDTFLCGKLVLRRLKSENTHGTYARNRADLDRRTKPDR